MPPVPSRPTITRRAGLDMPYAAPKVAAAHSGADIPLAEPVALPGEFDLNLELEVPAFLRRNEG
jgi:hypothetical protein